MPLFVHRDPGISPWCVLGFWASLLLAGCHSESEQNDRNEILRLEGLLVAAYPKHDVAAVEPILDDSLQYWSFSGQRRGKADMLLAVQNADESATEVSEPVVRIYERTAIYTARVTDLIKRKDGGTNPSRTCVTDVFVRRGSRWRLVASHESLLPNVLPPAAAP